MTFWGANGRRRPVVGLLGAAAVLSALSSPSLAAVDPRSGLAGGKFLDATATGVSALSPTDVWSVGYRESDYYHAATQIRHWDGSSWTDVAHPEPARADYLWAVDARTSDDVWAVGGTAKPHGDYLAGLIEHWDGSSWSVVASENPFARYQRLESVSADSATDAWAAGEGGDTQFDTIGLMEHWDGMSWRAVALPSGVSYIYGVTAVSPSDAWAVAEVVHPHRVYDSVILHWDGTAWSIAYSQESVRHNSYAFEDVAVFASDDIWVVGVHNYRHGRGKPPEVPYALHWDGSTWTPSRTRKLPLNASFTAVAGTASDDLWATGYQYTPQGMRPLIEHWDGSAWAVAELPSFNDIGRVLDVAAPSGTDAWAVGYAGKHVITLRWNGTRWRRG